MIHPTAIIDPKAEIHESVEIGPYCVIGPGVQIFEKCRLMNNVTIRGRTKIGRENSFFPYSVMGEVPQDLKYKGEDTRLEIGDYNTFREMVTVHLGTAQGGGVTRIGNHNLFMAYTHLGHDCIVGNYCIFANYAGVAGHVIAEDYVNCGGMVGIAQFSRLGAHSYITGQSGIERDVPRFCIISGSRPPTVRGANIVGLRRHGFDPQIIQTISEVVKLWMREDVPKERCLLEIESQYGDLAEIKDFIGFIRESKIGVIK